MSDALRLVGVDKHYGERRVLSQVDLVVARGECVALLGANGAGKSTLLRVAATLARPTSGHVEVGGIDARKEPEAARRSLFFLAQDAPLYDELSPMEHVRFWENLRGSPEGGDDAGCLRRLADAGLAPLAHRRAGELSRGQRQRVALAAAEVGEPGLLLLDEPFTALDAGSQVHLTTMIERRRGRGATLVVLQDAAQAARLADRVVTLRHGRLEES